MVAKNDITGDSIQTKVNSDAYRDGYERIFGKKQKKEVELPEVDVAALSDAHNDYNEVK